MGSNGIGTDSMSENVAEMFSYGWDANPHYPVMLENQTPFTSDSCLLVDMVPKIPGFETGDFSEDGALGSLLNGRRKRKNLEAEDEKKNTLPSSCSKRQAEDYILVRAKRGQATNSHSIAERVRREKISERMKLLQDLVPGCNKITGKAVMLDEIINYVQSLQQQVEFLSMKLATVNPDIDVDIERLLLKDLLLHPQGGNVSGPCLSSSHAFLHGFQHGPINGFQGTPPPLHPLPTKFCNNELQNVFQTGFDSNPSSSSILGSNGLSKMEM